MADEEDKTEPEAGAATTEPGDETAGEEKPVKLTQTVEIQDVGPCKKHIKVTVSRADIDGRFDDKFKELVGEAQVPGFRPGKAPRKVIVKRFQKDVADQVKSEVLLASLEQLAEEHDVAPLSPPDINPNKLELPDEGPFTYEFNVEVRPQFDLPNYKGLKLKRPVKTFTDEDAEKEERRILSRWGQLIPKEGKAEIGDYLIVDMTTKHNEQTLGSAKEVTLRVDDTLAFRDGVAEKFGEQVKGVKAGETKTVDITLSDVVANPQLSGQKVQATMEVKDVKTMRLPELTHEFLHEFGVHTPEQLREQVRLLLDRRLEYQQRQEARKQVLEQITAASEWQLPEDLLMRQARKALGRRVMEMKEAGMSDEEIRARQRLLQQDILQSTAASLKEHFVLQKVAEVEKIDVNEDDIDEEIERIADQSNESPRRVRAQLEKDDMLDTLAAQLIERKALDLILEGAEYTDVPLGVEEDKDIGTADAQAVEGELKDPGAEAEKAEKEEKAEAEKAATSPETKTE